MKEVRINYTKKDQKWIRVMEMEHKNKWIPLSDLSLHQLKILVGEK